MRHVVRHVAVRAAVAAACLLAATPAAQAQRSVPRSTSSPARVAELTPYAGVLVLGSYVDGPLGTDIRTPAAFVGGAQLSLALAPSVSLVGNVAYSRGDLEIGAPLVGGLRVGSSSALLYDGGIELRLPSAAGRPIMPFAQGGIGAITTRVASGALNLSDTNLAYNAGAGLDVSLGGALGVRVLVKDYISRLDAGEAAGQQLRGGLTHNVAASAGVRLAF